LQRWHGQERSSDSHGLKGGLVKEFMGNEIAMKICIRKRFYLGCKASYQVFKLTVKTIKHIQIEIFKRN
jgi:hypothetical protein